MGFWKWVLDGVKEGNVNLICWFVLGLFGIGVDFQVCVCVGCFQCVVVQLVLSFC